MLLFYDYFPFLYSAGYVDTETNVKNEGMCGGLEECQEGQIWKIVNIFCICLFCCTTFLCFYFVFTVLVHSLDVFEELLNGTRHYHIELLSPELEHIGVFWRQKLWKRRFIKIWNIENGIWNYEKGGLSKREISELKKMDKLTCIFKISIEQQFWICISPLQKFWNQILVDSHWRI